MNRRAFLQGVATYISLPQFSSLAAATPKASPLAATASGNPLRMAFLYVPNGVNLAEWRPKGEGENYQLARSLASLKPLQKDIQIIGGLDHDKAKANGDGAGDHARASATFLTGCQAKKTAGADIRTGISADQIAAKHVGHLTKLSSLELSTVRARKAGNCDSGYSCIYQHNISWRDATTPMPPEFNPRTAFEKLFGSGNQRQDAHRREQQRSVLDFVTRQSKSLERKLSKEDQDKLDEYLTSIRAVEKNIERSEKFKSQFPEDQIPEGVPNLVRDHIRSMFDVMTLAFKTDSTRIASFMLSYEGSNLPLREIGVTAGHHSLSHHKNNKTSLANIAKIDAFYAEQLAYFLKSLKETKEGDSNLLDNSMIVYGSSIADGNRHNHDDLPIILAGGGGGTLNTGRHIIAPDGTPMTNLYLSLLERMGVSARRIGDSSGKLDII